MHIRLAQTQLFGAWRLVEYTVNTPNSSVIEYPFGHDAQGLIVYSKTHMSVQIMRSDHSTSLRDVSDGNQIVSSHSGGYMAYAGRFTYDMPSAKVTHHVEQSLESDWIGTLQIRHVIFCEGMLTLRSAQPVLVDGKHVNATLKWRKL